MDDFKEICSLPGTTEEREWLRERLETLTVRESLLLAAARTQRPASDLAEVIRQVCSLPDYTLITSAESYEELGRRYLERETRVPWGLHDYAGLEKLGRWYEDSHPGLFIGNCYVAYPGELSPSYDGSNLSALEDTDWLVKLKLASPAVPEGVWLRLPDYDEMNDEPGEIRLALDALKVKTIQECILLEARCILPGIANLAEQYDDLDALIRDSQNLGVALDEQGQGMPHFMEKFLAALEFNNCRLLCEALDISQNLGCYDFAEADNLEKTAAEHLEKAGVPDAVIREGYFDLKEYGAALLAKNGFTLTASGNSIRRNENPFIREFSEAPSGMTMTM